MNCWRLWNNKIIINHHRPFHFLSLPQLTRHYRLLTGQMRLLQRRTRHGARQNLRRLVETLIGRQHVRRLLLLQMMLRQSLLLNQRLLLLLLNNLNLLLLLLLLHRVTHLGGWSLATRRGWLLLR